MNESAKMVIVLVIVSILSAASLSLVYEQTKPIIENSKLGELERSLKGVFPNAKYLKENKGLEGLISKEKEGIRTVYDAYGEEDDKIGVVLLIDTMGFGGIIKILVGIDLKTHEIEGTKILEHLETPGLGERITEDEFLNQFKSKPTETKADELDAITGATISSTAVINAVVDNINKMSRYIIKNGYEGVSVWGASVTNQSLENKSIENATN